MKTLTIATLTAALLLSSGCATFEIDTGYAPRMTWQEVQYYKVTCTDTDAKIKFLQGQLTRGLESWVAPDYETRIHMTDRSYNAALNTHIRELRQLGMQVKRDGHTLGCPENIGR